MTTDGKIFQIDPLNSAAMRKLMLELSDDKCMRFGTNEAGEDITISILREKIVIVTYQRNGWERKNIYYADGSSEELIVGKY